MSKVLNISKPCTVLVTFKSLDSDSWSVTRNGRVYHFRDFESPPANAKISFPFPGLFISDKAIESIKLLPLERRDIFINNPIPKIERNYNPKEITIEHVPNLEHTPARTWAKDGIIQKGNKLDAMPSQVAFFILLHELAHQRYFTEYKTDILALYHFLKLGYNESQAVYALTKVLNRNPANIERIKNLYNIIENK